MRDYKYHNIGYIFQEFMSLKWMCASVCKRRLDCAPAEYFQRKVQAGSCV